MTTEEKREYNKKYRAANKEKKAAYSKSWYEANREKALAAMSVWKETQQHAAVVYYLPEHHYVGVTKWLAHRLTKHRSSYNRVTEGCEIIYTAKDMIEARAVERYMHYEMGYNGKKRGTKGY